MWTILRSSNEITVVSKIICITHIISMVTLNSLNEWKNLRKESSIIVYTVCKFRVFWNSVTNFRDQEYQYGSYIMINGLINSVLILKFTTVK